MKISHLVACLLLLVAGCASEDAALQRAAREGILPDAFGSPESAITYTKALFAGGQVDRVRLGLTDYMVVVQHGSGRPVLGVALYREGWSQWTRIALPPMALQDFVHASASEGKIIMTEERSKRAWTLYDPAEKS